jgi:hypothetical protein
MFHACSSASVARRPIPEKRVDRCGLEFEADDEDLAAARSFGV